MDQMNQEFALIKGPPKLCNHRRCGRVLCQETESTLGEVLDVSLGGMRVRTRIALPPPGQSFGLTLMGLEGPIALKGHVVWTRKMGFFAKDAGIEFEDVSDAAAQSLRLFARQAAYNETVVPDCERFRMQKGDH